MQTQMDIAPRDGLPPVADLATPSVDVSERQTETPALSDALEQAAEQSRGPATPSWAARLERWSATRAESVPLPERTPILEAAGLKGPVALAGTTIGQIEAEAAFGPKPIPALQDALRKLPDLLKAPEAILANKGFRPDLWYVVTSAKDDIGQPIMIRLERADANNPDAGHIARLDRGPISGIIMDAKAKDVVLYVRDPAALPALGFANSDRIDPARSKAIEAKAAALESKPSVERGDANVSVQPSPDVVKRERLEAAARAEDQRLGIRREPGEDILSPKAVNERQAARRTLRSEQTKADVQRLLDIGKARAQDRRLGIERAVDEDPLSAKARKERSEAEQRIHFEKVRAAIEEDKKLGIVRDPGEDRLSAKAVAERAERRNQFALDQTRAALKLPQPGKAQERAKGDEQTKAKDKGGMGMDW